MELRSGVNVIATCLRLLFAATAIAVNAAAQSVDVRPPGALDFAPPPAITQTKNATPVFLRSVPDAEWTGQVQGVRGRPVIECPMPVKRPDISQLERMPISRPAPNATRAMPQLELNCPNPLDPVNATGRLPNDTSHKP